MSFALSRAGVATRTLNFFLLGLLFELFLGFFAFQAQFEIVNSLGEHHCHITLSEPTTIRKLA